MVALAARCAAAPPPLPEQTFRPLVQVPPGCLNDQSGEYVHAGNPAYRYRGSDDGGTLVLVVEERAARPDAGESRPRAPRVVLERTPGGFLGHTEAVAFTASGQSCAVRFPTAVVACQQDGLTLRAAATTAIDEQCQAPVPPTRPPEVEHRLVRKPLAADGGPG